MDARERNRLMTRCLEFEDAIDLELVDEMVRLDGMTAFLTPSLPLVWDCNYLMVERTGIAIDAILEGGDATIGAAGMRHRIVASTDSAEDERLAAELVPAGWKLERNVYMALTGEPDRPGEVDVDEVPLDAIELVRREFLRGDMADRAPNPSEALMDQLLSRDRRLGGIAGDRWFAAALDGEAASACRLLSRDGIGQVEDVNTLPTARERGLARATILAAVAASMADGNELTFIIADANDWPQHLYARLGFEPVGRDAYLRLEPDGDTP